MKATFVKLDMTNTGYAAAKAKLETDFTAAFPDQRFTVCESKPEKDAWIKAAEGHSLQAPLLKQETLDPQVAAEDLMSGSWSGPRPMRILREFMA